MCNNGRFYWATRDNIEVEKVRSGIFITYFALNGTGYVRTVDKELVKTALVKSVLEDGALIIWNI